MYDTLRNNFTVHSIVEVNISFTYNIWQYEAAGTMCWLALPRDRGDGGEGPGDRREPSEHQQAEQTALLQSRVVVCDLHSVCDITHYCVAPKQDC